MWELDYTEEVKLYFLDNYPYTFDLLVRIEELKFSPDAKPPEGCMHVPPNFYFWRVLDHLVIYRKLIESNTLEILVVKPTA